MITLYGVSDEITRRVIEKVLTRLPEKVNKFVMTWCLFVSLRPDVRGMMLPIHVLDDQYHLGYLIVVDHVHMQSQWAQDIVAHEIAHAWLDHTYEHEATLLEDECNDQAVEWGFRRKTECT
jgi:hypothetical protein